MPKKTTSTKRGLPVNTPPVTVSKLSTKKTLIIMAIIIIAGFIYVFRGLFVAATVNNQPITRIAVDRELEKENGKQVLDSLITKALIFQEARKENITVSQQEIDSEIQKIEKNLSAQGQTLDQALAASNMKRSDLIDQIRIQKIVEKKFAKEITVTDKEIDDYISQNKITTPDNTKPEDTRARVKQQLEQQKLSEKFQSWVTDLRKKAKINYIVNF